MLKNELTISLFGLVFKFLFEDSSSKNHVERCFLPFLVDAPPRHTFLVGKEGILMDGKKVSGAFPSLLLLADTLISRINGVLLEEVKEFLILHAGAIKKDSRVILVPGFAGSGKSTLVTWFILNGWDYLGEDLVFVSLAHKKIYPYTMPLRLKSPPGKLVHLLAQNPDIKAESLLSDDQALYHIMPEKISPDPLALAGIHALVFPVFSAETHSSLQPLGKKDAFTSLSTCCLNFASCRQEAFDLPFSISQTAKSYELFCDDFEHISTTLKGVVE